MRLKLTDGEDEGGYALGCSYERTGGQMNAWLDGWLAADAGREGGDDVEDDKVDVNSTRTTPFNPR